MLQLLKQAGPQVLQSDASLQAFSGIRGITVSPPYFASRKVMAHARDLQIFIAMQQRQDTFLARQQWLHLPFVGRRKNRREILQDIALQVPALLEQTDQALVSIEHCIREKGSDSEEWPSTILSSIDYLLDCLLNVKRELESWLQAYEDFYSPVPLYWITDDTFDSLYAVLDDQCIPRYSKDQRLRFRDGRKAGALVVYWAILLEVLMAITDIQSAIPTLSPRMASENLRAIELMQGNTKHKAAADTAATLIMQAAPYLLCCLEGIFAVQLALQVARRYFQRQETHLQDG
jgi:hypothetical protein